MIWLRERKSAEVEYRLYILNINEWIQATKNRIEKLSKYEEASQMSFEEWCVLQNIELKDESNNRNNNV
jgi:hypothetical protein